MEGTIFVIVCLAAVLIIESLYSKRMRVKKAYYKVRHQFGKMPEGADYDYEQIRIYWEETGADEKNAIDDLTWNDLDMAEIYERLNQCTSFAGDQYLYAMLRLIQKETDVLGMREEKMEYFKTHETERENTQVALMRLGKRENSYYLPGILKNLDALQLKNIWFYRVMQILFCAAVVGIIVFHNIYAAAALGIIFICNLGIYAAARNKYEIHLDVMESVRQVIYAGKCITEMKGDSYEKRFKDLTSYTEALKAVSRHLNHVANQRRANMSGDMMEMAGTYITGAFLINIIKYSKAVHDLENKKDVFLKLYEKLGEIDALISVVSFRESVPGYCRPEFTEGKAVHAVGMYHPLIMEPVCNDADIIRNSIVTGSNASGKSTFIKALAVNALLAQTIHTCTASQFGVPHAYVVSSMAVKDNILAGESYYIKEIKSLNRILKYTKEHETVICAIDEILRGTNTLERISASASILQYLDGYNCLVLVASHDMELVGLLDKAYEHYYFCELEEDDDISFDYMIHKGINKKTNAIRLLKIVGFPDEIVENANEIYNQIERIND